MELAILFTLQLVAMGLGFGFLWRRMERLNEEVAQLRRLLEERQSVRRANVAVIGRNVGGSAQRREAPAARAARVWSVPPPADSPALSLQLTPTLKGAILAGLALAPAIGLMLGLDAIIPVCLGILVGAAMLAAGAATRAGIAAWAGAITSAAWALLGLAFAIAPASPAAFAASAAIAAACALLTMPASTRAPPMLMALSMMVALAALGVQVGMASPAGVAFAAIMGIAAIMGGSNVRLEAAHLGAFALALIGLFILSGQAAAAIWFTPAAAWTGALFAAIAFIRAPETGARGGIIAATGALAPLTAVAALHASKHGLADGFAAGGAFLALSLALAALLTIAAKRQRGLTRLSLTAWLLAGGAFAAFAAGSALIAPPPIGASLAGAGALTLMAIDRYRPHVLLRWFACACATLAGVFAWLSGQHALAETQTTAPWLAAAFAYAIPAALAAACAFLADRRERTFSVHWFEGCAWAMALIGASVAVRMGFTANAPMLTPIGAAEAGAHVSLWLLAALAIAARGERASVHGLSAAVIGAGALIASCAAAAVWFSRYLQAPESAIETVSLWWIAPPALLFLAHWVFWRLRGSTWRARAALGSGAVLCAAAATLMTLKAQRSVAGDDWVPALVGAGTFAIAIMVTFAPGIAARSRRRFQLPQHA
jgi:hypothetical protein